jgi:hypothetical protein
MREKVYCQSQILPTAKADGGRQLYGDIGVGADGIDALDDVLQHRLDL